MQPNMKSIGDIGPSVDEKRVPNKIIVHSESVVILS